MEKLKEEQLTVTTVKHRGTIYTRIANNTTTKVEWKEKGTKRFVNKKTARTLDAEFVDGILTKNIKTLITDKKKQDAVLLYKTTKGTTLAAARTAVNKIVGVKTPVDPRMKEVEKLLKAGTVLAAVKLYKEITGMGLKESKEAVDAMKVDIKK